jgi:hypothetical protein
MVRFATLPLLLVRALNNGLVLVDTQTAYPLFDDDSLLFRARERFLILAEFTRIAVLPVIF